MPMQCWKCVLALCAFGPAIWSQTPDITGEWNGKIAGKLRVILRIEKMSAGTAFVEKAKAFVADANLDVSKLLQIEDALRGKLDELAKANGQVVTPE